MRIANAVQGVEGSRRSHQKIAEATVDGVEVKGSGSVEH
jgi:hypothetical protein